MLPVNDPPLAHALLRADGRILALDPGYAALLRMTAPELRRASFQQLVFHEDLDASLRAYGRALRTGEGFAQQKRFIRGDGTLVWVAAEVSVLEAQAGERMVLVSCTPLFEPPSGDALTNRIQYC